MAFPVQLSGIYWPVTRQLAPPFIDTNGNLYFVGIGYRQLRMLKSSDGGDSWSEVDAANRPDNALDTIHCLDAFQNGDIIHIAAQDQDGNLTYSTFRTSDFPAGYGDIWDTTFEAITTCTLFAYDGSYPLTGCSIVVRPADDSVIVFYNGDVNASGKSTVKYAKNDGTWSVDYSVHDDSGCHTYVHGACLGEGGKVHFAYGADDGEAYHKSLEYFTNILSSALQTDNGETGISGRHFFGTKPVYYDDDGVERITGTYCRFFGDEAYAYEIDDGGTPGDHTNVGDVREQAIDGEYGYAGSWAHYLAVEPGTKTVYMLRGGTFEDVFYNTCQDSGAWSGETELNDNVQVRERGAVVANVYVNGFNVVLGYVFNDNGVYYYDELILRTVTRSVSTSDGVAVSESNLTDGIPNPSTSDSIATSEYINTTPGALSISVSENISITESVDKEYVLLRYVTVSDSIATTESAAVFDITNPAVSDSLSVSENTILGDIPNPEVSDGVSVSENIVAEIYPIDIDVSDSTSITEYVYEWSHVPIPVVSSENIILSENVVGEVYNPPVSPRYTGIAVKYNVRLKNHNGVVTAVFDHFARLEYETRVNDVGFFSITFFNDNDVRFSQFFLDAQIEIWRSVPGQGVDYYKAFEGFFRKVKKTTAETGERLITFSGVSYNDLLARTIVAYKAGTIRADKNAPVETVMKEYVEENCGVTADDTVVGRLYQGYLPNFSVEPTTNDGVTWEGSRAFENLLDTLADIGQQTTVDFEVVGSGPAEFEFKTYINQAGKDCRSIDLDSRGRNPAGNLPVVFSTDFGFASDFSYTLDRMAEGNVVVVLGEGEGSTQTTVTRSDEDAVIASPWNRCEVSRPGTSQEYEYQLNQLGDEVLEELKAQHFVEFTPLQQPAQMYGVHYDLGYRVTVKSEDIRADSKIFVIHVTFERDVEQVELELGDAPISQTPSRAPFTPGGTGPNVNDSIYVTENVDVSI